MSRIEPAQGNQMLMRADVPELPVELARLKFSTLVKEAWYMYHDIPYMHATIGCKKTVGKVARINPLMA